MNRLWIALVLTLAACDQNKANKATAESSAPTPTVPSTEVTPSGSAVPSHLAVVAAQVQRFTGSFKAQVKKSTTTKKEGAPQDWEKDDGKAFSGEGNLTLTIAADGTVQGNLTGALGESALRGKLSGDELRAALVPAGNDVAQIQNGTLDLKRDGNGFKGTLIAATGNALVLREAYVTLTRAGS